MRQEQKLPPATEVLLLKAGASIPEESALLDILWATCSNSAGEY